MDSFALNRTRLIDCRKKIGITKQETAKRMLLSQPAYLRYESGERTPSIHVIRVMADVLNTSVDYLIGKTDDPSPDSYTVKLDSEPELFCIIENYKKSDLEQKQRMLAYLKKIAADSRRL